MYNLSLVITTRERPALVTQAIESSLKINSEHICCEIIVVDDGSRDITPSVVQSYPVIYVRLDGLGPSAARNAGIDRASGEFISFLDDDDIWYPGNFTAQLELLKENPEYGAVCGKQVLCDENFHICSGPFPQKQLKSGWLFKEFLFYVPPVSTLTVRTSAARKIGGFDKSLNAAEDWDFALRLAKEFQVAYIDNIALMVRQHNGTRAYKGETKEIIYWNRYRTTMKVFNRHIKHLPLLQRIKLKRMNLKLRGFYVALFTSIIDDYIAEKNLKAISRSLFLTFAISPLHSIKYLLKGITKNIRL